MKRPTIWIKSQRTLEAPLRITRPPQAASEGNIAVPGGNVWFTRVGSGTGLPLLVVHGGPGFPHNYLLSLQRLADEREVIFWDQLGCGKSETPSNEQLWTLQRSVDELDTVINALGLDRFHMFGHSWGGMLAQQYILDSTPTRVASLTLSNSLASVPKFSDDVCRLKSLLDAATQSKIDRHEATGTIDSVEYQAAIRVWSETYICRTRPWPQELEVSYNKRGLGIYQTLFGRSHFHFTGSVRSWDVFDRLSTIRKPALVVAGRFDECTPEHMWRMHHCIDHSRFVLFESSAHMPFIEEPERFDGVMRNFLRQYDGRSPAYWMHPH